MIILVLVHVELVGMVLLFGKELANNLEKSKYLLHPILFHHIMFF